MSNTSVFLISFTDKFTDTKVYQFSSKVDHVMASFHLETISFPSVTWSFCVRGPTKSDKL